MSFGTKLQDARKRMNVTQEQLADLLGVTRQTISRWELDTVYPDIEKIIKLSNVLGVSIDYLLKNEEAIKEEPSSLLEQMINKYININFYSSEDEMELIQKKIKIQLIGVSNKWIKVKVIDEKKKTEKEKIISLDSIASITVKEEK